MQQFMLLHLRVEGLENYEDSILDIDLINRQGLIEETIDSSYYCVDRDIYLPKVIGFTGINASGKSTSLKILSFFLDYNFKKKKVSELEQAINLISLMSGNILKARTYFYYEDKMYELSTVFERVQRENQNDTLSIISESLSVKKEVKRKSLYDFNEENSSRIISRNDLDIMTLMNTENKSILSQIFEEGMKSFMITNEEKINDKFIENLRLEDLQYLDSSFESLQELDEESYQIKIYGSDERIVSKTSLKNILSSGTKRGLMITQKVREVLKTGGYLIIDDFENNINTTIMTDIIALFSSSDTNPKKACLIFSTHYLEILDSLERNDQLFILHRNKNQKIEISNYFDYEANHEDLRSESLYSDYHNLGTAINYDRYYEFRKTFVVHEKL